MKKNNAMRKKVSSPARSSKVVKKVKSVPAKAVAKLKTLVKSMSAKPAKKPLVKVAPKASAPAKAAPTLLKKKATAPVKPTPKVEKVAPASLPKKVAPPMSTKAPQTAAAPAAPAAIKLKAKPETKKPKALSAAEISANLERMCRENACENVATTKGYCRLDYIKNWKKIKRKEMILKEGKLNQYIEELVSKYPEKYIDVIRQDLTSEVNFTKVIHDLELDESIDDLDYDGDSIDSLIGSVKKDAEGFDDTDF